MEKEYYINNYKEISKLIWTLLFASMIINGYLVQRCFEWNSNIKDKVLGFETDSENPANLETIIDENLMATQGAQLGLKINYGTLTLMWPFILLGLYFAVYIFILKKLKNIEELTKNHPEVEIFSLTLNSSSLSLLKKSQMTIVFSIFLLILPLFGLVFHGYSGYYMINLIDQAVRNWFANLRTAFDDSAIENSIIPRLKGIFWSQLVISTIVLIFVIYLNLKF